MNLGDQYRVKCAELHALALREPNQRLRTQYENLAKAYWRLAEQADRNRLLDMTYEPPPPKLNDLDTR